MEEQDLQKANFLSPYLGQDFLTWLWYYTENYGAQWRNNKDEVFLVYLEQRISVQGGEGDSKDTAVCSGVFSELVEARTGLKNGKKVNQAKMKVEHDSDTWQLQLKAEDFTFSGFKTPKINTKEEGEDPDASLLEKIYLIENCLEIVDELFKEFLKRRFSHDWKQELKNISTWIKA